MLRMKVFGVLVRERSIREWRRCLPPVRFIVSHPTKSAISATPVTETKHTYKTSPVPRCIQFAHASDGNSECICCSWTSARKACITFTKMGTRLHQCWLSHGGIVQRIVVCRVSHRFDKSGVLTKCQVMNSRRSFLLLWGYTGSIVSWNATSPGVSRDESNGLHNIIISTASSFTPCT